MSFTPDESGPPLDPFTLSKHLEDAHEVDPHVLDQMDADDLRRHHRHLHDPRRGSINRPDHQHRWSPTAGAD